MFSFFLMNIQKAYLRPWGIFDSLEVSYLDPYYTNKCCVKMSQVFRKNQENCQNEGVFGVAVIKWKSNEKQMCEFGDRKWASDLKLAFVFWNIISTV